MKLTVSGHHFEISNSLQSYIEEKIIPLERYNHEAILAEVTVTFDISGREGNSYLAEAEISMPGPNILAKVSGSKPHEAVDLLREKLEVQLRKHKELELERRKRAD
jgi:putative sigma-54 modulation protein